MVRKRTLHYFCLDCEIELSSAEELARPAHFLDAVQQQGEILLPIPKVEMLVVHNQNRTRVANFAAALEQEEQLRRQRIARRILVEPGEKRILLRSFQQRSGGNMLRQATRETGLGGPDRPPPGD